MISDHRGTHVGSVTPRSTGGGLRRCRPWVFPPPKPPQELVSVGIGDGRNGELTVLGHVKHKLVCSPDFEALLEHRHR